MRAALEEGTPPQDLIEPARQALKRAQRAVQRAQDEGYRGRQSRRVQSLEEFIQELEESAQKKPVASSEWHPEPGEYLSEMFGTTRSRFSLQDPDFEEARAAREAEWRRANKELGWTDEELDAYGW